MDERSNTVICRVQKSCMRTTVLTVYTSSSALLTFLTDASSTAIGAVLEQLEDDQWKPIGFFSRKLKQKEIIIFTMELWSYLLFSLP